MTMRTDVKISYSRFRDIGGTIKMRIIFLLALWITLSTQTYWSSPVFIRQVNQFSIPNQNLNKTLILQLEGKVMTYSRFNVTAWTSGAFTIYGSITIGARYDVSMGYNQFNNTWILVFTADSTVTQIARSIDPTRFGMTYITGYEFAASQRSKILCDNNGNWLISWIRSNYTLTTIRSTDDGFTWSIISNMTNCTNFQMVAAGVNDWYLAVVQNGIESLYKSINGGSWILVTNFGFGDNPQIAADFISTIMFVSSTGRLSISHNKGESWESVAVMAGVNSTISYGWEKNWILVTKDLSTYHTIDNGGNWINESIGGNADEISIVSFGRRYLVVYSYAGQIYSSISDTFPSINLVVTNYLSISSNVTINGSLYVEGIILVEDHLIIGDNFTLTANSTLDLSQLRSNIVVNGTFNANGTLVLPNYNSGTVVLVTYASLNGNFSNIVGSECSRLDYAKSSLSVIFSGDCNNNNDFELWKIILICICVFIAILAAIIPLIYFRKKVFPYRDRPHHIVTIGKQPR